MKKIISLFIILTMVIPSLASSATAAPAGRKTCIECSIKTNAAQEEKIVRTCNDVSDIICKDVKAEDRADVLNLMNIFSAKIL
ncbi:MAG: hypothetical protein H7336_14375 [Bacteriovorax sp.]|nr:hypothetical protein [Bacteriovorax sp.]